ncbi:MAG: DUF378 domain-containing protein [Candidatus Moraniibacteriota bacterium]|nr:MAG: DUF378 domain-containing protein [Candidatus Moranbacteria bacterium]
MKMVHMVAFILLIVGGINWLLVGVFGMDIGDFLFGGMDSAMSRLVYVLVGVAAIYEIATHKKNCRTCESSTGAPSLSQM